MSDLKKPIKVRVESHYGRTTVYPVCDTARVFADIAGTKTLTSKSIRLIKSLGFEVEVQAPELKELLNG